MRRQIATSNTFIIVDGEKYLTFSHDEMPQSVGFCVFDKEDASNNVKYIQKRNIQNSVFVWLALLSKGISTPLSDTRKDPAITVDIDTSKCVGQFRSFIEEHHTGDEYKFWPDLAPFHYANETTRWFLQQKIKFRTKTS